MRCSHEQLFGEGFGKYRVRCTRALLLDTKVADTRLLQIHQNNHIHLSDGCRFLHLNIRYSSEQNYSICSSPCPPLQEIARWFHRDTQHYLQPPTHLGPQLYQMNPSLLWGYQQKIGQTHKHLQHHDERIESTKKLLTLTTVISHPIPVAYAHVKNGASTVT